MMLKYIINCDYLLSKLLKLLLLQTNCHPYDLKMMVQ